MTLQPALKSGVAANSQTERLCYLAAHVLFLDDDNGSLRDENWGRLSLQLSNQVDCVKAAIAAFGAAYEAVLDNAILKKHSNYASDYYTSALAKLRLDLNDERIGAESLALTSILLAFVEILTQHEQNAFTHFLGCLQIIAKAYQLTEKAQSLCILDTIKDALVKMNLSISSYGLSRTPQLMYLQYHPADGTDNAFHKPGSAANSAMLCLHRSYQFIESAHRLRYKRPSWKEYDAIMCKEHCDVVAQCQSVIDGFATLTMRLQAQLSSATPTPGDCDTLAEIYAIRAQVTSTLIFILCIHNPYEMAYDEHKRLFRSIITDAAASARLRRQAKPSVFKRFSMRPGIISPLFFVTMKCRDPSLRALATAMLAELSREGPADGQILAAIGARLAALESAKSEPPFPGAPLEACNIPEEQRIYGHSVPPPRINAEGRRVFDIEFMKPNPPLAQGLGRTDYSRRRDWIYWSEPIEA
ncbi:hypothetical protein BJY04DRAFT_43042 [Aspergillus karnatakaensis]|uniref:uncharacterized protein n=1 Tax=Aspergillus karnatakaensis TaxID=1810916 RepID=UPI003CCDD37E